VCPEPVLANHRSFHSHHETLLYKNTPRPQGYILQPPCLWGDQPGLEPMPKASGVKFLIKAITNSTYGHHGEMAFPEVTLVPWKNTSAFVQK
jgi:hypothetical protein